MDVPATEDEEVAEDHPEQLEEALLSATDMNTASCREKLTEPIKIV